MKKIKSNHILIYFFVSSLVVLLGFQNCSEDVGFSLQKGVEQSGSIQDNFTVGDDSADSPNDSNGNGNGQNDNGVGTPTGIEHPTTGNAGRPVTNTRYCDDPAFAGMQLIGECLALFDTFDRDQVTGAGQFNWSQFIDDSARMDAQNVQANIFQTGDHGIGQSLHESHAVYVTGRRGGSVHEVYLISQPLNLNRFNDMRVEFNYLPIMIENFSYGSWSGWEHIRMDICSGTMAECTGGEGASTTQVRNALRGDSWNSLYQQPGIDTPPLNAVEAGDSNNGRNHIQGTWLLGASVVDLDDTTLVPDKSQVIFRITILLDEGFTGVLKNGLPDFDSNFEDGMGLDYVKVFAIQDQL